MIFEDKCSALIKGKRFNVNAVPKVGTKRLVFGTGLRFLTAPLWASTYDSVLRMISKQISQIHIK